MRLTSIQKEIVQIMKDNPSYYIIASDYEHGQDLTDGILHDGINAPFRKCFYKSTLNRLIMAGLIHSNDGKIYRLINPK